ncbi:hypothetical protein FQN54_009209 [Arachnomyces sp. PD_36]|nr:hypothetical protein FQN54_009209 [Arachnomyces sp. PD_36]
MAAPMNGTPLNGTNGASHSDLIALADHISRQTKEISNYLQANHYEAPTFSAGSGDPPSTPEYLALHSSLKTSLEDLQRLVDGPRRHMRAFLLEGYDLAAFQVALDFRFFDLVPRDEEILLEELARKAGLDVDRASRIVRMMITHRFFQENRPGYISHNNASYILQKDEEFRCTVHYTLDEMWKAATATSDSLKESPYEVNSEHTAFSTRHGLPIFKYYAQDPKRAGRFARAMAGATRMDRHLNELRDCFDWGSLKGKVVDVGGGSGHISIALAKLFPSLEFVVQDGSNDMLVQGKALLGDDVRGRVSFMQHSFFEPQPLKDAGCFLIRQCTHNWCDKDVVTMFKSIVPGLEASKPGTPFLVNDIIMPEPGTIPRHSERELRQIDLIMLVAFGAKQRTRAEFEALLKEADSRFVIRHVQGEGLPLGLLEVYLEQ